jgi:tRNA(fMet)-specific endonuclease VapC
MRYLLDTDIVSQVVREPRGSVAKQMARVGTQNVCVSIIVAAELRYGAFRKNIAKLTQTIEHLLERLVIEPFDNPADRYYAEIRSRLEQAGTPIGQNDTLIAAHALALDCTLVTDNEREFSRIKTLRVENWLK